MVSLTLNHLLMAVTPHASLIASSLLSQAGTIGNIDSSHCCGCGENGTLPGLHRATTV